MELQSLHFYNILKSPNDLREKESMWGHKLSVKLEIKTSYVIYWIAFM